MMNLIERSVTFAAEAKELDALKKTAFMVAAVGTRAQMLESALVDLRLAGGRRALLQQRGIRADVDVSAGEGFVHHLAALKVAIKADPSAVTEGAQKTLTPLRVFTTAISEACAAAWDNYVRARLPQIGTDTLPLLAQIPALKTRVERFRVLQSAAFNKVRNLPTESADFDALDEAAAACHAAWEALDADSIPAGVTRFLRTATSDTGAALDMLTEEVCVWLKAHNLAASFTIRAR